jgi:replication fork protection complex subunit Tof1/Swi1
MAATEVIDLTALDDAHDQEPSGHEDRYDARQTIQPVITTIIDALGGVEQGKYRMGEQAGACLKDLKKLWRRDDTDDDRTVARIFWEKRLLQNDLVPILLATAGEGLGEDKRAISCVDLMTAMTWPIDMAEELKELDEEEDRNADFTHLLESHLYYKASLVRPDIMKALFNIIIPPLSKSIPERTEKDCQIVTVVLYLIRNLAFVKDLRPGANLSAHQLEFTSLQSRLIKELSAANFLEFFLTISSNSEKDPWLTGWNTIALEILYLFYRGVSPTLLSTKQIDVRSLSMNIIHPNTGTATPRKVETTTQHRVSSPP